MTELGGDGRAAGLDDALSPGQFRFLRYWSLNMTLSRRMGQAGVVGFSYTEPEMARMQALSLGARGWAIALWLTVGVLTYFVAAALAVALVIGGALLTAWRGGANVTEVQIFLAIALIMVAMLSLGMPLSITVGGAVTDTLWRERPSQSSGDAELHAKVTRQFRRMGLVMAALFVVAAVAWGFLLSHL